MAEDIRDSFNNTEVAFAALSNWQLKKANFLFSVVNSSTMASISTSAAKFALSLRLPVEGIIRSTVFEHFCGGQNIEDCQSTVKHLAEFNVKTILDYSVEGEKDEESFERTTNEVISTIENAREQSELPFAVFKVTGIASSNLLTKVQESRPLSEDENLALDRVKGRINRICKAAFDNTVPVFIDAEDSWYQDVIDAMAYDMMKLYNQDRAIVYNTYQMYKKASLQNLKNAHQMAAANRIYLGAKLVRGAYMEIERERAHDRGYEDPIHPNKDVTDEAFNNALRFCINEKQRVYVVCGSHNEYSNYYLTVLMSKHNMANDDPRAYFSQLYGMSDNISFNLASKGYNVAKYVPYGPVRSVMPYLFRRASENTSIAGQTSRELTLIRRELSRRRKAG